MSWAVGDLVRVGKGATTWRIVEFITAWGDPYTSTLANLERVDRSDVHTTVALERLTVI